MSARPPSSKDTIQIGTTVAVNQDAAIAASGLTGVSSTDGRAINEAVIRDINGRGGVFGRKFVPVYFERDSNAVDQAAVEEAQCATFTQDNRVFAASGQGSIIEACLARAGVINTVTYSNHTTEGFRKNPLLNLPNSIALDRLAAAMPGQLRDMGYLRAGPTKPRIGVFTLDTPAWRDATDRVLLPQLKAAGFPVTEVAYTRPLDSNGATADASAQTQNAVLQFRSSDIDHVVFFDILSSYLFLTAAASQAYEPRYAFTSNDYPATLALNVPASQLTDAVSIGWLPLQDIPRASWDAVATAPSARCRKTLSASGIDYSEAAANTCDRLYFLEAALRAGGPRVSASSFLAGEESLGRSFRAAASYGTFFGPGRHDGSAEVRHSTFKESCTCFAYTSTLIALAR